MKGQNIPQEKDFIVLNLSKGYVLHIEVKENVKKYQSAIKQFHDGRESLMKIFNSIENMSQDWKYIGMPVWIQINLYWIVKHVLLGQL